MVQFGSDLIQFELSFSSDYCQSDLDLCRMTKNLQYSYGMTYFSS